VTSVLKWSAKGIETCIGIDMVAISLLAKTDYTPIAQFHGKGCDLKYLFQQPYADFIGR
jgi:hypothetical protein